MYRVVIQPTALKLLKEISDRPKKLLRLGLLDESDEDQDDD